MLTTLNPSPNGASSPIDQAERLEMIAVRPGDLGRVFHFLPANGIDGVRNRPVEDKRVARYARSRHTLPHVGMIKLLEYNPGHYYIVAGQHRIKAISDHADRPYMLAARIWSSKAIKATGLSLAEIVTLDNLGRTHSRSDDFATLAPSSPYYQATIAAGLTISLRGRRSNTRTISLYDYVMSVQIAKVFVKNNGPHVNRAFDRSAEAKSAYLHAHPSEVEFATRFLAWWSRGHEKAANMGVMGLSQRYVMALGYVLFSENQGNSLLESALDTLVKSSQVEAFRRLPVSPTTLQMEALAEALRCGANHRRVRHMLSLFGRTGREE